MRRVFSPAEHAQVRSPVYDGFQMIYHGSLHERYGLDLAIRAVERVRF